MALDGDVIGSGNHGPPGQGDQPVRDFQNILVPGPIRDQLVLVRGSLYRIKERNKNSNKRTRQVFQSKKSEVPFSFLCNLGLLLAILSASVLLADMLSVIAPSISFYQ